jgi:hypothetical protein
MATGEPPEKLAVDVALAEFDALRAEITSRITTQAALVGVGLTALGVLIGLAVENDEQRLLLAVPPLALVINLQWSIENRQVALIGKHIRTRLWRYLQDNVDTKLPSWEREMDELRQGRGYLFRSSVTDFAMPQLLALAAVASLALLANIFEVGGKDETVDPGWLWLELGVALLALAVPYLMRIGTGGDHDGRPASTTSAAPAAPPAPDQDSSR